MKTINNIDGGLYLVVDPFAGLEVVLPGVEAALEGGVDILQVWNNWSAEQDKEDFIHRICALAGRFKVPVLINEEWRWLNTTALDGVHFDKIPDDWESIKHSVARPFLAGLTCGNDFTRIQWAIDNALAYISFCAMFPSRSAGQCEIIDHEIIRRTRQTTNMPIFVSGGITPENCKALLPLDINGIAVISGILKAADPKKAAETYKHQLLDLKTTI